MRSQKIMKLSRRTSAATDISDRRPVPLAEIKRREQALRDERRKRREARDKAQAKLWKAKHFGIRIRWTRATIGEIYNMARKDEALLTLRLREPIIVPWKGLIDIIEAPRMPRASTDEVFQMFKNLAKTHAKDRKAVKHPKWRDPAALGEEAKS